jgi:hypothetical protein
VVRAHPREPADHLTCQELVELVTESLEDALPPHERALFAAHLDACEGCETYLQTMLAAIDVLHELQSVYRGPAGVTRPVFPFGK